MENKFPLRIAVLCNYRLLPQRIGGMDRFFWEFNEKCLKEGIKVDWFFPNLSRHGRYEELNIVACEPLPVEKKFIGALIENAERHYDIIFTHFIELCTLFYRRTKDLSPLSKIIAVDHNPRPIGGYSLMKKIKKIIKGKLFSRHIDCFIAVSEYTKKEIIKDFGKQVTSKIQVIYNGIDVEKIAKRLTRCSKKPTFMVGSHLRLSKGIQDLIIAVRLLPAGIKEEIKIDVYGEGNYLPLLEALVSKYQLNHQVEFKGPRSSLFDIFQHYDYLLQPTHMECFSLGILESLAANVPVITTPVGGNEEVVKHGINGLIANAQDSRAWSVLLEQLWVGNSTITGDISTPIRSKFNIQAMVSGHFEFIGLYKL